MLTRWTGGREVVGAAESSRGQGVAFGVFSSAGVKDGVDFGASFF